MNCRKLRWRARCGIPNTFLTLTVDPARYETPDDAARDLKRAFVNLRRRMDRQLGIKQLPFIAVFEKTKEGWPHLHILMRCKFIPQAWISAQMRDLTGAPVVDIRFIKGPRQVTSYVAKYVGKMPVRFTGTVRFWCSRNWVKKADNDNRGTPIFDRRPDIIGKRIMAYKAGLEEFGMATEMRDGLLWFGDRIASAPPAKPPDRAAKLWSAKRTAEPPRNRQVTQ